jgi:hypothetical protein
METNITTLIVGLRSISGRASQRRFQRVRALKAKDASAHKNISPALLLSRAEASESTAWIRISL